MLVMQQSGLVKNMLNIVCRIFNPTDKEYVLFLLNPCLRNIVDMGEQKLAVTALIWISGNLKSSSLIYAALFCSVCETEY